MKFLAILIFATSMASIEPARPRASHGTVAATCHSGLYSLPTLISSKEISGNYSTTEVSRCTSHYSTSWRNSNCTIYYSSTGSIQVYESLLFELEERCSTSHSLRESPVVRYHSQASQSPISALRVTELLFPDIFREMKGS